MSNVLRLILWSAFSLGMLVIAVMAFWVFLVILGIALIAKLIYSKFFPKTTQSAKGSFTVHTYTIRPETRKAYPHNHGTNQDYTTVIDADDPDKEYKVPKIK